MPKCAVVCGMPMVRGMCGVWCGGGFVRCVVGGVGWVGCWVWGVVGVWWVVAFGGGFVCVCVCWCVCWCVGEWVSV